MLWKISFAHFNISNGESVLQGNHGVLQCISDLLDKKLDPASVVAVLGNDNLLIDSCSECLYM